MIGYKNIIHGFLKIFVLTRHLKIYKKRKYGYQQGDSTNLHGSPGLISIFDFNREFVNLQRVVGEVDRTVAQGWRQFVTRVLGTLPAPILFGYIIDNACTIWRTNFDGKQGNCWVYDLDR